MRSSLWMTACMLAAFSAASIGAADTGVVLHVAADGNDANDGSQSKPFATVQRARDAVRATKAKGPLAGPVTIVLAGGTYRLDKTLEFGPEDSGAADAPITYKAAPGQRPVLSGGRAVTGWRQAGDGLWKANVPGIKEDRWYFHQLFVNGHRRTRARTPNQGFLYTEGILAPYDRAKWWAADIEAKRGFRYRPGDIRRWRNFDDAMIVVYHSWTTSIHLITALDEPERAVRLAPRSGWPIGHWWEYNTRYHVENVGEALDAPGEWYLDRKSGELTYWPLPGEDMTQAVVVAPVVRQTLVAFRGDPAAKKYVEHLRFEGISFQHADALIAPDMPVDHQGATGQKPLIEAQGLRHGTFEDCEIAHAGENGVWLGAGCCDNVIRRCHVHDLGGGAVYVGMTHGPPAGQAVERNVIDNCFIHDGSHIFRGSQGVWMGRASHNQVTHNEISDFHHLGVSVGYSWGYAPSSANHNRIEFNHIHHICNGYFSDGGGIYALGVSPGTVIRNNHVHDVRPTPQMPIGGCGIYLDEGSTGILVENNVVHDVGAGAFTQHYGRENVIRNNVFAMGGKHVICCCRVEDHLSYTFEGNIVLSDMGQIASDHYSPLRAKTAFNRNVYWDASGEPPLFGGVSWSEWRKTGRDADSRIADPLFVDAGRRDFALKAGSPALAMGFRPIEIEKAGLYGDAAWTAQPKAVTRPPIFDPGQPPPPPPPRPLVEDFESTKPGKAPFTLHLSPSDRPDAIQVCTEAAGSGKQSLKMTKTPNLPHGFQPHVYYGTQRYTGGKARFVCELMSSAAHPADVYVGLRDYKVPGREYADGPVVRILEGGDLVAGGKTLAKVPPGTWVRLEFLVDLDPSPAAATTRPARTYDLTMTIAGAKPQAFTNLPYADERFNRLSWFGFSSVGKAGSVFYVDSLRLEPR